MRQSSERRKSAGRVTRSGIEIAASRPRVQVCGFDLIWRKGQTVVVVVVVVAPSELLPPPLEQCLVVESSSVQLSCVRARASPRCLGVEAV